MEGSFIQPGEDSSRGAEQAPRPCFSHSCLRSLHPPHSPHTHASSTLPTCVQENATGDGVVREWFSLLAAELTHPDTGLLETNDGGKTYSPAPHASLQSDHETSSAGLAASGGHLQKFEVVGAMLGVALLQGCTLPGLGFTAATWRLALGQPPLPAADLEAADPVLHRSLQQLLAMGPGVADLSLHFEVQDMFGRQVSYAAES